MPSHVAVECFVLQIEPGFACRHPERETYSFCADSLAPSLRFAGIQLYWHFC